MPATFHTTSRWIFAIGLALIAAAPARAQYGIATLSHADGGVTRLHAGAPAATTIGVSIMDGDQVETANGRAEITFLDGTLMHLDRQSVVLVLAGDRVKMVSGRVSLRTSGNRAYIAEAASSKIHVQAGTVIDVIAQAGRGDATVRVVSGKARIESSTGSLQVPDYHKAYLAGSTSAPAVTKVVMEPADEFERWALTRLVMASSTPLRGTEFGGGVAYSPWAYYSYPYYAYSYPSAYAYSYTYTRYYYPAPYSYSPGYSSYYAAPYSSYYPSSYFSAPVSSSYWATAPYRSYYSGNSYGAYGSTASSGERFTWSTPATSRPATPASMPTTPSPPPAPGAVRRSVPPKP